jgi:hypothetical protein
MCNEVADCMNVMTGHADMAMSVCQNCHGGKYGHFLGLVYCSVHVQFNGVHV